MYPSYVEPKGSQYKENKPTNPQNVIHPKQPKPDTIAYPLSYSHDIEPEHFRGYEVLVTIAAGLIIVMSLWPMFSQAAQPEVPEFCASGFEKIQYSGKFIWKTGKPLKVKIGMSNGKVRGIQRNTPVAHIFDRMGKCFAVCQPSVSSQNLKNPNSDSGMDFQCSTPSSLEFKGEFKDFASHVVIAPHPERAPAIFRTPLIRFGTYLKGYSEAILQTDARPMEEPVLAGN